MKDRAMQALYLLALAPVAETTADKNSYGFRIGRSTHDAITQVKNLLDKDGSADWFWKAISRCLRGGSWYIVPGLLRSAYRLRLVPDDRLNDYGFRVARTLTP